MDIVINYWAVVGAAVVSMVIGTLWYGPLFGKQWMAMTGITKESMKSMSLTPIQAMGGGFVMSLIMAYVLAHFIGIVTQLGFNGYVAGFWVWLGFVMTTQAHPFLWEGKPFKLFTLNGAYTLVTYLAMGALITWMM